MPRRPASPLIAVIPSLDEQLRAIHGTASLRTQDRTPVRSTQGRRNYWTTERMRILVEQCAANLDRLRDCYSNHQRGAFMWNILTQSNPLLFETSGPNAMNQSGLTRKVIEIYTELDYERTTEYLRAMERTSTLSGTHFGLDQEEADLNEAIRLSTLIEPTPKRARVEEKKEEPKGPPQPPITVKCPICLEEETEHGDCWQVLISPNGCGHVIHKSCFDTWKKTEKTCPVCKAIPLKEVKVFFASK